jgi:hypothetical protein
LTAQRATPSPQKAGATRSLRWGVRARNPLAVPLVAIVALVTACGGGDEPISAAPTATPSSGPTATTPPPEPVDPLSPQPALESAAPLGQPTCRAATLTVTDADLLTSGSELQEVFAIRTTGPACQLRGWPAVRVLRADGTAIALQARRVGTARAVTLTRATSVSFVLGTPRGGSCEDAATLIARLPGTDRDLRTSTTMQVCGASLRVGPVERRQDDEGAEH